ncbi:MAG: hypothetical protein ING29_08605 [Azospirillum sp.]|nr:hypothetical protein [Azospirillum sp.]
MTDKLREEIAADMRVFVTAIREDYVDGNGGTVQSCAEQMADVVMRYTARARADALEEAAKHLIDEDLDNAEAYAAAIRSLARQAP